MLQKHDSSHEPLPSIDISILIVNWNAREILYCCLASIQKITNIRIETIVVDNASSDGSVQMIANCYPGVRVIENYDNNGFASANNQAVKFSGGCYLLLLNPDTEICPGAIEKLMHFAKSEPDIAAVGPRLLNPDGTVQRSSWRGYPGLSAALIDALYLWKLPWLPIVRESEKSSKVVNEPVDVNHVLGACMLIPRAAWNEVGPMDEGYFLFLEETDWCRRANKMGKRVVYYPLAEVIHHGQHSMRQQPSRNLPHLYRSYCRFYRESSRNNRVRMVILKIIIVMAITIRYILWLARDYSSRNEKQNHQAREMLNGYHQVLRELPSM